MADERKIVIEIVSSGVGISSDGDSSQKKKKKKKPIDYEEVLQKEKAKAGSFVAETIQDIAHPIKTIENTYISDLKSSGHGVSALVMSYLTNQAAQTVKRAVDYQITRHLSLTEDYLSQNEYNAIKAQYSSTMGALGSLVQGAAAGAFAGPAGAVIGAILGGINYGVNTQITRMQEYSQYYQQLNAVSFNTQYNAKRAGLYDGSRGTEG